MFRVQLAPCRCERPVTRSEQLRTATIQPGVYERSDYLEPINALIGISQQKQFDPMRITSSRDGIMYAPDEHVEFPQYDRLIERERGMQSESDVYDPRFTGYGPTNRGYIDPTTGAPRFFYDDVNAVTMPNFICRSNVDIYPWAPQYGSGVNGSLSDGIGQGDGYKRLAENAFEDATIKFRTEMQERLLRKRNAELWQRRAAPIHTMG